MKTALKVLVVDDEPPIRKLLRLGLGSQGYEVLEAANGKAALEMLARRPQLVVLDLGLPDIEGLELLKRIRQQQKNLPVIVLSSRGDEGGKVAALDLGADDYVTKPFGMDELLARIRAALRRQPPADAQSRTLDAGQFHVDLDAHVVTLAGEEIRLTPKEFDLLAHLVRNAGKVLTHHALLGAVWGGDYTEQHEYLRVFIGQLRKKIETDPSNPRFILTEPWVGYRFNGE